MTTQTAYDSKYDRACVVARQVSRVPDLYCDALDIRIGADDLPEIEYRLDFWMDGNQTARDLAQRLRGVADEIERNL
jgi:hypothetical protein